MERAKGASRCDDRFPPLLSGTTRSFAMAIYCRPLCQEKILGAKLEPTFLKTCLLEAVLSSTRQLTLSVGPLWSAVYTTSLEEDALERSQQIQQQQKQRSVSSVKILSQMS